MERQTAPFLDGHRVFHSHAVEETRAFLGRKGYQVEISLRQATRFQACLNAVYMPSLYLGYMHYGDLPVTLRAAAMRSDYLVQLPIRGQLTARIAGQEIDGDASRAIIASPVRERCEFVSSAGSMRLQVALNQGALVGQLTALLGEQPREPLEFMPAMELTRGHGRSLAQHVLMAAASLDEEGSVLLNPITMSAFEQFIMTALLLSHPHNYSEALQRCQRSISPRDVKRAIEYIEGHLDQPVTVADLVRETGVAGRTLFMHFKQFQGVSPIRYLRNARLRQVRQALLRADPGASVTAIAMGMGFTHMSRFSAAYRQLFGESPSRTLRSCKDVRAPCLNDRSG